MYDRVLWKTREGGDLANLLLSEKHVDFPCSACRCCHKGQYHKKWQHLELFVAICCNFFSLFFSKQRPFEKLSGLESKNLGKRYLWKKCCLLMLSATLFCNIQAPKVKSQQKVFSGQLIPFQMRLHITY